MTPTLSAFANFFGCAELSIALLIVSICFQMVKEKPNSTRIYDKDGFRRRAACICVRAENEAEVSLGLPKHEILVCFDGHLKCKRIVYFI